MTFEENLMLSDERIAQFEDWLACMKPTDPRSTYTLMLAMDAVPELLAERERLAARLEAAELVCTLFGWMAVNNSEVGKAAGQAWSQWRKAHGSPDPSPEWDERIVQLAAERDRVRAETLERLRGRTPNEIVLESAGAGFLAPEVPLADEFAAHADEALVIAEQTLPAQAEALADDGFDQHLKDLHAASLAMIREMTDPAARLAEFKAQMDKSSVHAQPEGEVA